MWVIHSWPWYWLVWPWWGGQMYRIVTGVTSDVSVPSTHLVHYGLLASLGHLEPWCCLCRINMPLFSSWKDFNYLCHLCWEMVENTNIFMFPKINWTQQGLIQKGHNYIANTLEFLPLYNNPSKSNFYKGRIKSVLLYYLAQTCIFICHSDVSAISR